MSRFAAPIAEQIWDMKYRLKEAGGMAIDASVEDTWRRIARALAAVEAEPGVEAAPDQRLDALDMVWGEIGPQHDLDRAAGRQL